MSSIEPSPSQSSPTPSGHRPDRGPSVRTISLATTGVLILMVVLVVGGILSLISRAIDAAGATGSRFSSPSRSEASEQADSWWRKPSAAASTWAQGSRSDGGVPPWITPHDGSPSTNRSAWYNNQTANRPAPGSTDNAGRNTDAWYNNMSKLLGESRPRSTTTPWYHIQPNDSGMRTRIGPFVVPQWPVQGDAIPRQFPPRPTARTYTVPAGWQLRTAEGKVSTVSTSRIELTNGAWFYVNPDTVFKCATGVQCARPGKYVSVWYNQKTGLAISISEK